MGVGLDDDEVGMGVEPLIGAGAGGSWGRDGISIFTEDCKTSSLPYCRLNELLNRSSFPWAAALRWLTKRRAIMAPGDPAGIAVTLSMKDRIP